MELVRDPSVVAAARRHALDLCGGRLDDARCVDLAIVVSELVTNAIRHGRDPVTLEVRPVAEGVRVEVTDADPEPVAVVDPGPLDTGRRGLLLVDGICRRWGCDRMPAGKRVWCEV